MKHSKFSVFLLTVIFSLIVTCLVFQELRWDGEVSLSVTIESDGHTEELFSYYDDENNIIYLFLPSYADLSESFLYTHHPRSHTLTMDGVEISRGMSLENIQLDHLYELSCQNGSQISTCSLTFLQSGNVPTMYITTASGTMDYIHEAKGNEEAGTITVYNADGTLDHSGLLDQIKGRGNSTWGNYKNPYNFKLSQEADLLGMGQGQVWVLLAEFNDGTYFKNKTVYDFAKTVGMAYSPDCDWVDLYLNGEYYGLYLLCEHIDIHPNRLDISKENSFLISIEGENRLKSQDIPHIPLAHSLALRLRDTDMEPEEIEAIWFSAQNAILAENGIDPITQKTWQELIDVDSWAMRYLIDEVFANQDGGFISQYFYYDGNDPSGKIYAGPVWDMDLSMGQSGTVWQTRSPRSILAGRPHLNTELDQPLFYSLLQKEEFHNRVVELYETVFLPALSELLDEGLDAYISKIKPPLLLWYGDWYYTYYTDHLEHTRQYMTDRIAFLNDLWLEGGEYCFVQVNPNNYNVFGCFAVKPGECLLEIPEFAGQHWYRYDTDEPFDITQPIYEDVSIYWLPTSNS